MYLIHTFGTRCPLVIPKTFQSGALMNVHSILRRCSLWSSQRESQESAWCLWIILVEPQRMSERNARPCGDGGFSHGLRGPRRACQLIARCVHPCQPPPALSSSTSFADFLNAGRSLGPRRCQRSAGLLPITLGPLSKLALKLRTDHLPST